MLASFTLSSNTCKKQKKSQVFCFFFFPSVVHNIFMRDLLMTKNFQDLHLSPASWKFRQNTINTLSCSNSDSVTPFHFFFDLLILGRVVVAYKADGTESSCKKLLYLLQRTAVPPSPRTSSYCFLFCPPRPHLFLLSHLPYLLPVLTPTPVLICTMGITEIFAH